MTPHNKLSLRGVPDWEGSFDTLFGPDAIYRLALNEKEPPPDHALRCRLSWNPTGRFYECSFYWEKMTEAEIAHRQRGES